MQRGLLIGCVVALTFTATASAGFYNPPAADTKPVWSPDGSVIVYYRGAEGLHVVNPDGSGDRLLAGLPNSPYFSFSRDWHWLALAVYEGAPGLSAIEVMRPDGSQARVVANGACCVKPVFSPDGTRVAYADGGGIWIAGIDGGAPTRLAPSGVDPNWSPDGQRIAYTVQTLTGPHVVLNTLDGTGLWDLGTFYLRAAPTRGPAWSRDGRLAFIVGTPSNIAVYDFGTSTLKLTRVDSAASLEWSPDGTRILFADAHGVSQLNIARGVVSPSANGSDAAWSPDGSRIAYSAAAECGDRAGIYVDTLRITNDCRVWGTDGPDTLRSSNMLYQIVLGLGGDDTLIARGGPYVGNELDGGDGNDLLRGGSWSDRLFGGPGNDTLLGGLNSDRLTGGSGTDILRGQGGQDLLFSRDGEADLVDCGTNIGKTNKTLENDKAYVDSFDLVVHCEKVFRTA
jgi:Tol biopolymer transport system component